MLPDWGKVEFHPFAAQSWDDILPGASSKGRDLVRQLVCYESSQRLSADEVSGSQYPNLNGRSLIISSGPPALVFLHTLISSSRPPQECPLSATNLTAVPPPIFREACYKRLRQLCYMRSTHSRIRILIHEISTASLYYARRIINRQPRVPIWGERNPFNFLDSHFTPFEATPARPEMSKPTIQ